MKYALMTQGVPVETIPVTPDGEIMLENHMKWIEHRMELEASRRLGD